MKLLNKIEVSSPVINSQRQVINCEDFTGELSSKTGIIARGIYIAKIVEQEKIVDGVKEQEVISLTPDIIIECNNTCEVPCKNLYKVKNVKPVSHFEPVKIEAVQKPTPDQVPKISKYF